MSKFGWLILTGNPQMSGAGCDDFLRKPYRESDIFETMEKHLGIRFVWEDDARKDRKPEQKETEFFEKTQFLNSTDILTVLSPELLSALEQEAKIKSALSEFSVKRFCKPFLPINDLQSRFMKAKIMPVNRVYLRNGAGC